MPGSAGPPRTVTVKRRGSKRRADADDWDTPRRDTSDPAGDRDDRRADPARAEHAAVRAQ